MKSLCSMEATFNSNKELETHYNICCYEYSLDFGYAIDKLSGAHLNVLE